MQKKIAWPIIIFLSILAVVFLGTSCYFNPSKNQETRQAYFWNGNDFEKKLIVLEGEQADLDNNLTPEDYILQNGVLTIIQNKKIIWQSQNDWWIDSFILADSNNDGVVDINLSLWKPGNFGTSRPFWIKENDMSIKNHFFVLDFVDGSIKQIWGSSNLSQPNCEFKIADVDDDEKNDLVVIEGSYSQNLKCIGNYVAVWKWNGWGFSNEWRSEKGNFANLELEKKDGKSYIIVDTF